MRGLDAPALLEAAQAGDNDACERLLIDNSGLIWSVARRYYGRGVDPEDLYQLGCLGFLKAIRGFDTAYGTQFSTYAVPKIAGEIRRFLRDDGAVKVSRGTKERAMALRQRRLELAQKLGREPTVGELAQATGLEPEDIAAADNAMLSVASLQGESGEEGFSLEAVLGDGGMEDDLVEKLTLRQAIDQLPERERMVIFLRFYKNLTQDRVSKVLGVRLVQVPRLARGGGAWLREALTESRGRLSAPRRGPRRACPAPGAAIFPEEFHISGWFPPRRVV